MAMRLRVAGWQGVAVLLVGMVAACETSDREAADAAAVTVPVATAAPPTTTAPSTVSSSTVVDTPLGTEETSVATASPAAGSAGHHLTALGRERLVELLREPVTQPPPRNGLLLRLFFGGVIGPETCWELVADARRRADALLAELARERDEALAEPASTPQRAYWLLTISAGEHVARAWIAWADEALAVLSGMIPLDEPT